MADDFARKRIARWLADSGVQLNGANPWDPQIHNPAFYNRVLLRGSLGLGESYADEWWDCARLDEMYNRLLRHFHPSPSIAVAHALPYLQAFFANLQTKTRAFEVGERHYDIGNDLYRAMLDSRMIYTCGYWKDAENLDDAQRDKLELVCRKLDLQKGMRVLDIGCGWGGFARYAAEKFGARVVGITVSKEQMEIARQNCAGLPVEFRLRDYRDLNEQFDAVVSLGMFEHVGHKNYRAYMRVARSCLADGGRFVLQTIGKHRGAVGVDPWIAKYIFPNGEIPTLRQLAAAAAPFFIVEDLHNFGPDYDRTLSAWFENFDRAWPQLRANYPPKFYRIWKYYLQVCAGAFRARNLQLWQVVLTCGAPAQAYRRPLM